MNKNKETFNNISSSEQPTKKTWWENCSFLELLIQFISHPKITLDQIEVACDMRWAPAGSNQEEFPTLKPSEVKNVLEKENYLKKLITSAKLGDQEALSELSSIADGRNNVAAKKAIKEIEKNFI